MPWRENNYLDNVGKNTNKYKLAMNKFRVDIQKSFYSLEQSDFETAF